MSKTIHFRSPTDETLYVASTNGQCARIGTDWREIPACLHAEAIAAGAVTSNMDEATADAQRQKVAPVKQPPKDDPAALIRAGIVRLLESGDEDALTKAGLPNLGRLSTEVGFSVGREQMQAVWNAMEAEATAAATEDATV